MLFGPIEILTARSMGRRIGRVKRNTSRAPCPSLPGLPPGCDARCRRSNPSCSTTRVTRPSFRYHRTSTSSRYCSDCQADQLGSPSTQRLKGSDGDYRCRPGKGPLVGPPEQAGALVGGKGGGSMFRVAPLGPGGILGSSWGGTAL